MTCLTAISLWYNFTSPRSLASKLKHADWTPQHWHGLAQAASPFSDGTPQASQWPIPPMHFFDYELHPEAEDAGTYFYHSHVGFQAVSAAGPLIVEDASAPPYSYDDERVFFLSDIFNKTDDVIEQGLQANPFTWSGETNNVLVNGYGITAGYSVAGPECSLPVIDIKPDTTYRFRFIGGTALSLVLLAFQGHSDLQVIEVDGQYTKPYSTSYLQVGSGQRYSILFKTKSLDEVAKDKNSTNSTYYIQLETRERPTLTRAYALLTYTNSASNVSTASNATIPASPPLVLPNQTYGFLDYQLQPYESNNFPSLSEVTRRVTMTVHQIINGTIIWAQNGYPWIDTFPQTPYLISLYEDLYTDTNGTAPSYTNAVSNGGMDNATRTFPANIGEVLEIVLQNTGATNGGLDVHPFHAHGGHFWDLGSGNGTYDVTANEARLAGTNPVLRDTTMLYRYGTTTTPGAYAGWRAWRLRVTEPGVWMIHCHTLQHMIMGKCGLLVI
ncbi:hypothetical protein MMC28_005359 [Mycoblastus sanguinarius]|nr:hypothetical protein [Mycoblastus sanguinarius]